MKKNFLKIAISLITIFFVFCLYASTVGIKTNKLNTKISNEIKNIDENLEIDFKKVKLILKPFKLRVVAKIVGANLKYNNQLIKLQSIKTNISLKSLLNKKFSLTGLNISTKSLEVKELISFLRLFKKDIKFYIAEQFIKSGYIIADLDVEFDENGKIKDSYIINGFVKEGQINLFKKYDLNKIDFIFDIKKNNFELKKLSLLINNKQISIPKLIANKIENKFKILGQVNNDVINLNENDINDYFEFNNSSFKIKELKFKSQNEFNFEINKKFKIDNLEFKSDLNVDHLIVNNKNNLTGIFPKLNKIIKFNNHQINLNYKEDKLDIEGAGEALLQENSDKIEYKFLKTKKNLFFDTNLKVNLNQLNIDILDYQSEKNSDLQIKIKGNKILDKNIIFEKIDLKEKNNNFKIINLSITKNKIDKFDEISFDFNDKENLRNKIQISKKNNSYILKGKSFNANKIIENLLDSNKSDKSFFNDNFKLIIDIKKVFLNKKNPITDLNGYVVFKDNNIEEANLLSKFSDKKEIIFSIKKNGDEKITTLYSHKAKPLVDRYKFIKGFEKGSLDFYSTNINGTSNSVLKIYDFKLKELPALTKILTLASLQGIADILSGEGITFNEFEMNFSNDGKLMTINEIYAIGPAISILMDGYVEKNKLISLRGTLVPATTLNKTIGSIPLLGKILVGNKVGEGVFGVSFKIKGPSNKLETSVNPIKTLTPRFITRTLEKIKKN